MKLKQIIVFVLSLVCSMVFYSEVQANEVVDEAQYETTPQYHESLVIEPVNHVAKETVPVVTNLNDLQKTIFQQMQDINSNFQVRYTGDTNELKAKLMDTIRSARQQDDFIMGILLSYGYEMNGYVNNVTITFTFEYTLTKQQNDYVQSNVKKIVSNIIKPKMTDVEKVAVINEYIVKNTTYSLDTKSSPHSPYTILSEGEGVCQAYATLAYLMLQQAGLDARYVTGYAGQEHAWNLVKVDGQWYHLDTTWNDPTFNSNVPQLKDYISYKYFLMSDQVIAADHTMHERPGLPSATSERFSVLHEDLSSVVNANGTYYVLAPQFVDGYLYFVNRSSTISRIHLYATKPTVESFANVRAYNILAANGELYFIDKDRSNGLSKINLHTKEVTNLYAHGKVTSIEKDSSTVYAYNNGQQVFTYDYVSEADPTVSDAVQEISDILSNIQFLSSDFKQQAKTVIELKNSLSADAYKQLSSDVQEQIASVEQKYNKMTNLTFTNSTEWAQQQTNIQRKSWSIYLSKEMKNNATNLAKVQVVDMFGDPIDVTVKIENKKITVTPNVDYVPNVPYTLVIQAGIETTNGDVLKKGTHVKFNLNK